MEEEDSMKRKKIYGIFMLVAIAVFLFAGGRILQIYLNYQESNQILELNQYVKEHKYVKMNILMYYLQ